MGFQVMVGYLVAFGLHFEVKCIFRKISVTPKIWRKSWQIILEWTNQSKVFAILARHDISEGVLAAPLPSIVRCRSCIAGGAERLVATYMEENSLVLCVDFQGRMLLSVCSPFSHSFTNIIRRQSTIYRVKKMFELQFYGQVYYSD